MDKQLAATLALGVYEQSVLPQNLPIVPATWIRVELPFETSRGFAYSVFRTQDSKEVVIAYRGTDAVMRWDGYNDVMLYLGFATSQAKQAAQIYQLVSQQYEGAKVSFTGHSLGGGLASMMGVWFDLPAITFDPAPFEKTATDRSQVKWVKDRLTGPVPDAFNSFDPATNFLSRQSRIESHYAVGEFLNALGYRVDSTGIYSQPELPVTFGNQQVSMFTMHSQALLTAGLLCPAFAEATRSVPASLPVIMSAKYYSPETEGLLTQNFLLDLIRSEQASPGAGKLTHFAADLQKLGTNLSGLSAQAQSALIAQAVEWYYWQTAYTDQEFFAPSTGALQYTTAQGAALSGAENKASSYVKLWLDPSAPHPVLSSRIAGAGEWNVATSAAGSMAAARDPGKAQIFVGSAGPDQFTGGQLGDLMFGGAGNDTYVVGTGRDVVRDDLAGEGQLSTASGAALQGGRGNGKRNQWVGAAGETYTFTPSQANLGTLTIGSLGAGNEVRVEKFDYDLATAGPGYLGIKLDNAPKVALQQGGESSFWRDFAADAANLAGRSSMLPEGLGKLFTISLSSAAKAGETIGLKLLDLGGKGVKAVLGSSTVDADGAVIPLAVGQTQVTFALVQDGSLDADAAGSLVATYHAQASDIDSNSWGLAVTDAGATGASYRGDQRARLIGIETQLTVTPKDSRYGTYAWSETSWAADGTLIAGVPELDFADVLYASTGNDAIDAGGGNDAIAAGAGHDVINGGAGDDLIGGGSGSDVINGGAGNDFISSGGNSTAPQRLGPADAWQPPAGAQVKASGPTWGVYMLNGTVYWAGMGATLTNADGDTVDAGPGDDTVIAGWGDDHVQGGDGNDQLEGLAGADILEGGAGDDFLDGDGSVRPGALDEASADTHGADFLDGGDGADVLLGSGGDDDLFGGAGNDQIAGDSGGPTNGAFYVALAYHGDDYLDGEAGDDYLEGGGGEDTLYGGADNDTLWGDTSASFVASAADNAALWADDYLDGGDGSDVLIGGGMNDTLYGGLGDDELWGDEANVALAPEWQGQDYLDGGDGADYLEGGGQDDTLFGGSGNDTLWGDSASSLLDGSAHGNDYLDGGDGDDSLIGNGGSDTLLGGAGNDILLGDSNIGDLAAAFHGDDYLDGGDGDDLLLGDGGNDVLLGGAGADQLQGGAGDDQLSGGDGADMLFGEDGNDVLAGELGDDQLMGGAGDDVLDGGDGMNTLYGQEGNDTLIGGAASDRLQGGTGDDQLSGGGGDDLYSYSLGDGVDHITDSGGVDRIIFTNISSGQVELGVGSLKIVMPDGGEIHLDDFDPEHPLDGSIELFQFSDAVLTRQQLIESHGFSLKGTPQDDVLTGTALADRVDALDGADVVSTGAGDDVIDLGSGDDIASAGAGHDSVLGGAGDDYVIGGPGNDVIDGGIGDDALYGDAGDDQLLGGAGIDLLAGGPGSDVIEGGDGDDIYAFGLGDGQDSIIDAAGANTIQLGTGITDGQLKFRQSGNDLSVAVDDAGDRLLVKDWFVDTGSAWTVGLDDGSVLTRAAIDARLTRNQAPVLGPDVANLNEDDRVPASGNVLDNDTDPDGSPLRVSSLGEYDGAYGHLSLMDTGAFTYTLDNASEAVQSLAEGQTVADAFSYTATDDDPFDPASATSTITALIQGSNDLPVLGPDAAGISEDADAPTTGNVLENDSDIDAGTILQVATPGVFVGKYGTLDLQRNGTFSYALDNASPQVQSLGRYQQGTEQFAYLVNDGVAEVDALLDVLVFGQNDAPTIAAPLPDQSVRVSGNASYTWQVPAGSFADVDASDTLSYTACLADGSPLPSWLAFDNATSTFSGQVPSGSSGFLDIQVTATDGASIGRMMVSGNLSVADVFRLSFDASKGCDGDKGNEGVGNGEDPPPPGHDSNQNDGPGTSPGHPGEHGGHSHHAEESSPAQVTLPADCRHKAPVPIEIRGRAETHAGEDDHSATRTALPQPNSGRRPRRSAMQAADAGATVAAVRSQSANIDWPLATGAVETVSNGDADVTTRAYALAATAEELAPNAPSDTYMARWISLDDRLLAHLGAGRADMDDGIAAGGVTHTVDQFAGAQVWCTDPLARAAGQRELPVFEGLKEGLRQVAL